MQEQQPSRGGQNVEPPPGYVHQSAPPADRFDLSRALAYPFADPGGFAFVLFWIVAFGLFLALWTRKKRA
jgi:hypothetical protein